MSMPSWFRRSDGAWSGQGPVNERHLRCALEDDEFVVHYQPVVDTSDGSLAGLAALVRWQRPDGTVVPPARFMPAAGATGVMVPLSEFVLRTACAFTRRLQIRQSPRLRLSVSLGWRQLIHPELAPTVQRAFYDAGLAPQYLEIGVAQDAAAADLDGASAALARLRALGVSTTLDDYGLEPDSAAHLEQLGVQAVTVDLGAAACGDDARAAVRTAVAAATAVGVRVTARRVETPEQLDLFQRLTAERHVEYVQGYAFGEPVLWRA